MSDLVNAQLWARAVELLGDGEWHDYESVVYQLGKVIPPGMAMRRAERERLGEGSRQRARRSGPPVRVKQRPVDELIASGRRSMVRIFLKSPRFEKNMPGHTGRRQPGRQIRMVRLP